jgi:hypothetical protein
MKTPSIKSLRKALVSAQKSLRSLCSPSDLSEGDETPGADVRLNVQENGWKLLTGDSSYDQDHRGLWSCGFLPYGRTNLTKLAKELILENE